MRNLAMRLAVGLISLAGCASNGDGAAPTHTEGATEPVSLKTYAARDVWVERDLLGGARGSAIVRVHLRRSHPRLSAACPALDGHFLSATLGGREFVRGSLGGREGLFDPCNDAEFEFEVPYDEARPTASSDEAPTIRIRDFSHALELRVRGLVSPMGFTVPPDTPLTARAGSHLSLPLRMPNAGVVVGTPIARLTRENPAASTAPNPTRTFHLPATVDGSRVGVDIPAQVDAKDRWRLDLQVPVAFDSGTCVGIDRCDVAPLDVSASLVVEIAN